MGLCNTKKKEEIDHNNETIESEKTKKKIIQHDKKSETIDEHNKLKINQKNKKYILHYNILGRCGIGNYSKVYLCESLKNNKKKYAIKTLKKSKLIDKKAIDHFKNEITIIKKLNFDFIITIKDIFELNQREYIVLPYYNLELFQLIKLEKYNIPENIIKIIISQIYSCIVYLHDNKIIYRDLKPENVMLDINNGIVKLIDFGLSVYCEENKEFNEICGTNQYIPPEVIERRSYSYDIDEWEFGIFCYELVYGHTPFKGHNQSDIFNSILHDDIDFNNENREISEDLLDLLKSLLNKEKGYRIDFNNVPFQPFFEDNCSGSVFEYISGYNDIRINNTFRNQLKSYFYKYIKYSNILDNDG